MCYHDSLSLMMNTEIEHRNVNFDIESARRLRERSRTGCDEFEAWCPCRVEWQVSLYCDAHESGLEGVGPSLFCMEINFLEYSLKESKLLPFVETYSICQARGWLFS
jgi:hypothetical protein